MTGGIFVIWIDPPYDSDPAKRTQQIVESIKQEQEESQDICNYVMKFEDFEKGAREGKINVVTGIEGLSQIGEDIDMIDYFYNEVGKRVCRRIQDLGMVMDVSHLNDKCFWDVMDLAQGPIIASHSNSRVVCPHMRNLSDEMLKAIAATGGSVNLVAMTDAFDATGDLASTAVVADNLLMALYFFVLAAIPAMKFFLKKFGHPIIDEIEASGNKEDNHAASYWTAKPVALIDIAKALVVPALLVGTLGYVIGNYYGIFIGTVLR